MLNNYAEAQILILLPREHLSSRKKREIQQMVNQVAKQYHVHPDVVNVQLYEKSKSLLKGNPLDKRLFYSFSSLVQRALLVF
ncbi:hypothetical protein AAAC51_10585 [Priestia megaterium]